MTKQRLVEPFVSLNVNFNDGLEQQRTIFKKNVFQKLRGHYNLSKGQIINRFIFKFLKICCIQRSLYFVLCEFSKKNNNINNKKTH